MNAMTDMPSPLVFTDAAAAKVKTLIDEEGNPDLKLRVFVSGGGCSGFQYGFTFDEVVNEDDTAMNNGGVTLLIDPMSYQYLVGAEIDYQEGLEGAQFVIKNPNAQSTCGCGSFAELLGLTLPILPRRINRAQHAFTFRAGDFRQIAGTPGERFAREPRERQRLHLLDGHAVVCRREQLAWRDFERRDTSSASCCSRRRRTRRFPAQWARTREWHRRSCAR